MANENVNDLITAMPFAARLGIEVLAVGKDVVRGQLRWAEELCTAGGILHGGALMSFGDTLGAVCAFLNLPSGATTGTIESKTNFFRAVREGHIVGVARPLHVGRTTIVVQTDMSDAAGKRVAQVTQTQAVIQPA